MLTLTPNENEAYNGFKGKKSIFPTAIFRQKQSKTIYRKFFEKLLFANSPIAFNEILKKIKKKNKKKT